MKEVLVLALLAVLIRLAILPFTLKSYKYISVMRTILRALNKSNSSTAVKCSENPITINANEIAFIGNMLHTIDGYKNPFFFIISIAFQAAACLGLLFFRHLGLKVDFLWLSNLSEKDPFYLLPFILLLSLIIRHCFLVPHKKKYVLAAPAFLIFFMSLNWPAGLHIFLLCLILISTLQSALLNLRYGSSSLRDLFVRFSGITDGNIEHNPTADISHDRAPDNYDMRAHLLDFKKKASLFLYDDVLMAILLGLLLGLAGVVIYLLYWAYFRWRQKREWLLDRAPMVTT